MFKHIEKLVCPPTTNNTMISFEVLRKEYHQLWGLGYKWLIPNHVALNEIRTRVTPTGVFIVSSTNCQAIKNVYVESYKEKDKYIHCGLKFLTNSLKLSLCSKQSSISPNRTTNLLFMHSRLFVWSVPKENIKNHILYNGKILFFYYKNVIHNAKLFVEIIIFFFFLKSIL